MPNDYNTSPDHDSSLQSIPFAFMFPIGRIIPQRDQPRSEAEKNIIDSIAGSVDKGTGKRVGGTGYIQPLLVRWREGAFGPNGEILDTAEVEIIAGETRYWAGQKLGLKFLPVIVTDVSSEDAYEDAVTENILRGDLTPEDEGRAFQYLRNKHGISALGLARHLYSDDSREGYIQNRLDLLRLNDVVKPLIDKKKNSLTAAKRIMTVSNEDTQRELVAFMLSGGTFKELNEKIQKLKGIVPTSKEERENRKKFAENFGNGSAGAGGGSGQAAGSGQSNGQSSQQPGGSSSAGIASGPRVHVGDALDSIGNQLERVAQDIHRSNMPASVRHQYIAKTARIAEMLEAVEAALLKEAHDA